MKPIHEMLNRIRWDKEYSKSEFSVGFYDRVLDKNVVVPFCELYFDENDHFSFHVLDDEGEEHTIPYHRIRQLYKDGELIWSRE